MVELQHFDSLPWHDSVLLSLSVDRINPGVNDVVNVEIRWPDGKRGQIAFTDCYFLDVQLNFGVIAEESILNARMTRDDEQLALIQKKWLAAGVNLDRLNCYEIRTNSTDSRVRVYALTAYSK